MVPETVTQKQDGLGSRTNVTDHNTYPAQSEILVDNPVDNPSPKVLSR